MSKESLPIYDSAQRRSLALEELKEIIHYRYLLLQLIRRDVLTRYKRSMLGIAWTMLNPLGTMIVLSIAFSRAFGGDRSYPAYVLSGLVAWIFFSQTTHASMVHLIWGEGLLKRIYVPRTIFTISAIGTGLVNMFFSIVPLILVMLFTGTPVRPTVLFLPVPILFLTLFAIGVGLLISTLAVYFADVAEMYGVGIMAWMYLSPVIYPPDYLGETTRTIIAWVNPMYHLINLFRAPVFDGVIPNLNAILISGTIAVATVLVGWFLFTLKSDEFAYRL